MKQLLSHQGSCILVGLKDQVFLEGASSSGNFWKRKSKVEVLPVGKKCGGNVLDGLLLPRRSNKREGKTQEKEEASKSCTTGEEGQFVIIYDTDVLARYNFLATTHFVLQIVVSLAFYQAKQFTL